MSGLCFPSAVKKVNIHPVHHHLSDKASFALAGLLEALICGEESAVLAFRSLSHSLKYIHADFSSLCHGIMKDEMEHDRLLLGLQSSLPIPENLQLFTKMLTAFYLRLADGELFTHLARILALDSGACIMLTHLRKYGTPVQQDNNLMSLFGKIHKDEARHASLSRYMLSFAGKDLFDCVQETRESLCAIMLQKSSDFEDLNIDVDLLHRDLTKVSRSLLN